VRPLPLALRLTQRPDEHRPEDAILLAVDQQLGEGVPGLGVPPVGADRIRSVEVGNVRTWSNSARGAVPRDHFGAETCPPDPYEPPRGDIFAAVSAESWLSSIT
jgi:hypothetical protein